jgi:hypothetical protein
LVLSYSFVSVEAASSDAISSLATRVWPPRAALNSAPSQPADWSLPLDALTLQARCRRRTISLWPYLDWILNNQDLNV